MPLYKQDKNAGTILPLTKMLNHMKQYRNFCRLMMRQVDTHGYNVSQEPLPPGKPSVGMSAAIYLAGLIQSFMQKLIHDMSQPNRHNRHRIKCADIEECIDHLVPPEIATLLKHSYLKNAVDFWVFAGQDDNVQNYARRIAHMCRIEKDVTKFTLRADSKQYLNWILNMMLFIHVQKAHHYTYNNKTRLESKHIQKAGEEIFHKRFSLGAIDTHHEFAKGRLEMYNAYLAKK